MRSFRVEYCRRLSGCDAFVERVLLERLEVIALIVMRRVL